MPQDTLDQTGTQSSILALILASQLWMSIYVIHKHDLTETAILYCLHTASENQECTAPEYAIFHYFGY